MFILGKAVESHEGTVNTKESVCYPVKTFAEMAFARNMGTYYFVIFMALWETAVFRSDKRGYVSVPLAVGAVI